MRTYIESSCQNRCCWCASPSFSLVALHGFPYFILFYFFFSGRQTVADFLGLKTNDKRWGPPLYMSLISVWDYTRLIRRVDLVRTRHRKSPSCLTVLVRLSPFLLWYTHTHTTLKVSPHHSSQLYRLRWCLLYRGSFWPDRRTPS
jgi:hypothetical protein